MGKEFLKLVAGCKKPVNQLTPAEIFGSESFQRYCETTAAFLTDKFVEPLSVHITDHGDFVAFTNGDDITLNYENDISQWYTGTSGKVMATLGILFHEIAHCLFLPFDEEMKAIKAVSKGKFYGDKPVLSNPTLDEQDKLDEFVSAYTSREYSDVMVQIYHNLSNIIADPHDEEKISMAFHGIVEEAIGYSTDSLRNQQKMLEEYTEEEMEKNAIGIMFNLILSYARFGEVPCRSEKTLEKSEFYATLNSAMPCIDNARYTDSTKEKFSNINQVAFYLWGYIEKKTQQNQQGQSSSNATCDSNSNNGACQNPTPMTKEEIEKIKEQLEKAVSSLATKQVENRKTAKNQPSGCGNAEKKGERGRHRKEDSSNAVKGVLEAAATEAAENQADSDAQNAGLVQVNTCNQNSTHRGVSVHAHRCYDSSNGCRNTAVINEIKPYSKRMQKQVMEVLRDLQEGTVTRHKLYGKGFEARDAYRPDGRFFSNKKQPLDVPDMAVSVLVDQSGSMGGERAEGAMRAAVMLYDFCCGLEVPCQVAGHSASNGVDYTIYAGFVGSPKKDIQRICSIPYNIGGCNRDGMALTISADGLSKRPEQEKLLFIICDGQPNHRGYGGEEAAKDIRSIVSKYKKLGVEIIACAIGDDKERIQDIYGNGFLNISDLSKMPCQLVKILKKRLTTI